jgi:hypothetical protein
MKYLFRFLDTEKVFDKYPEKKELEDIVHLYTKSNYKNLVYVVLVSKNHIGLYDSKYEYINTIKYTIEEIQEPENTNDIYLLTFGHESIVFGFKPDMDTVCKSLRDLLQQRNRKVYEIVEENDLLNVYDSEGSLLYIMPYTLGRTIMIKSGDNKEIKESNSFR